jgi:hypothetical protein
MSDKIVVLIESGTDRPQQMTFSREEVEPWDELEALKRKSQAPCDRHEGGECDCGDKKAQQPQQQQPQQPSQQQQQKKRR